MDMKDQVVLVTGANRGIGKAYVEECLNAGASKVYLGVRDTDSVSEFISANPDKLIALKLDVTNERDIEQAAKTAHDATILINNAGVAYMGSLFEEKTVENAHREMEVNYFGPLNLIRAFAPILKNNGGGAIISVSSIGGHIVFPGAPTYCASKFAVHALVIATRMELSLQGTRVIGVYPGPVDTDMAKDIPMEKVSANHIALETINALVSGSDDVFPDPYAKENYELYRKDPKAAENMMLDAYQQMANAA